MTVIRTSTVGFEKTDWLTCRSQTKVIALGFFVVGRLTSQTSNYETLGGVKRGNKKNKKTNKSRSTRAKGSYLNLISSRVFCTKTSWRFGSGLCVMRLTQNIKVDAAYSGESPYAKLHRYVRTEREREDELDSNRVKHTVAARVFLFAC